MKKIGIVTFIVSIGVVIGISLFCITSGCVNTETGEADFSVLMLPFIIIEEYSKVPSYAGAGIRNNPQAIPGPNGSTIYVSPYQTQNPIIVAPTAPITPSVSPIFIP